MKLKQTFLVAFFFLGLIPAVAKSAKQTARPLWASADTVEEIFPNNAYIARLATAKTPETALSLAEGELGRYFSHSVEYSASASQTMKSGSSGTTSDEREIQRNVLVTSSVKLFAVNHTDAWFNKETEQYTVCAYIDRKEAWSLYEPKIQLAKKQFMARYEHADEELDALKKMIRLQKARPAAQSFLDALDFGHSVYPAGEKSYAQDRAKVAALEEEILSAQLESVMCVKVQNDLDDRIQRCVNELLSRSGFQLSERAYAYIAAVTVSNAKTAHEEGILTCDPGIQIAITNGSENIFTYAKTFKRISGFKEEVLDRKIFSALEKELQNSFVEELQRALE